MPVAAERNHIRDTPSAGENFNSLLVLLCHKWLPAAGAYWETLYDTLSEFKADGGDRVGDVAFGSQRRRRGVDNLWVGEVL